MTRRAILRCLAVLPWFAPQLLKLGGDDPVGDDPDSDDIVLVEGWILRKSDLIGRAS